MNGPVTDYALPEEYFDSMLAAESANRDRVSGLVEPWASADLVAHVAGLRLYVRVPFFLTQWISDPAVRARVSAALATDIVAMKLLDDLMDDDTGLNRIELACISLLLHLTAVRDLCAEAADPRAVTELLERDFGVVCTGQITTKREPARDLAQWQRNASTYGATFLGCYGTLAAICGRVPDCLVPARSFAEAFGMIITIADDLSDYHRHGERAGNLGHLIRGGVVTEADFLAMFGRLRDQATQAARQREASAFLVGVVNLYADDVVRRLLPGHL